MADESPCPWFVRLSAMRLTADPIPDAANGVTILADADDEPVGLVVCGETAEIRFARGERIAACVNLLNGVPTSAFAGDPSVWVRIALAILRSGGDPTTLASVADNIIESFGVKGHS